MTTAMERRSDESTSNAASRAISSAREDGRKSATEKIMSAGFGLQFAQMPRYFSFQFAEVFPEEDPLSEWLVTVGLAMNDLALVHARLDADQDEPDRAFYWHRVALSHFTEAARFLKDTEELPEVNAFLASLPNQARRAYTQCLAIFQDHRGQLFRTRNKATFHYPDLRPANPQEERPVRDALAVLRDDRGVIRATVLRDARALFADDVVAEIFARNVGGLDALPAFFGNLAAGTTAFIRFANLALEEHFMRARDRGAIVEVEPIDPNDLRAGFQDVAPE